MISLLDDQIRRASRQHQKLVEYVEQTKLEEALSDRADVWAQGEFGGSLDGSISSIVHHLALWKTLTLPAFSGSELRTLAETDLTQFPSPHDWDKVSVWFLEVSAKWAEAIQNISAERHQCSIGWEGEPIEFWRMIAHMLDHDVYHYGQLEYQKARRGVSTV